MSAMHFPTIKAAGKSRQLNVRKDPLDIRDRMYEPALMLLASAIDHRQGAIILDQGQEGACTGFGLAAVINLLTAQSRDHSFRASPRMLYEMAKKHDEWPGEDYDGSSCRGAIRGWKNMGVCSDKDWPYDPRRVGVLTVERAKAARAHTLGAYYRLRAEINDYHAALNETGAVFVSADVHAGWDMPRPATKGSLATIKLRRPAEGGHAFAIVGYDADGFIVQNSWGRSWGTGGFALWPYEDWVENIIDGWVFRLAIPTPQVFGLTARSWTADGAERGKSTPKRLEIAGHFVHLDDGRFQRRGTFWSTADDVQITANRIQQNAAKYDHLLIYAHGGLNSSDQSARRIASLKDGFKRNRIYPYHIMYDTGLAEELEDAIIRAAAGLPSRGFFADLKEKVYEVMDKLIEDALRRPGTAVWDEIKADARRPFFPDLAGQPADGLTALETLVAGLAGTSLKIHLVGHSAGAILIGHLLAALDELGQPDLVASCSLMAPACSVDFYHTHYAPRLSVKAAASKVGRSKAAARVIRLPTLDIYSLTDAQENDDNVAGVYHKSLLYFVSRALERRSDPAQPLLGMQRYAKKLGSRSGLAIHYAGEKSRVTRSMSHGGFDNDLWTMNSILKRVLGKAASEPFENSEMKGC